MTRSLIVLLAAGGSAALLAAAFTSQAFGWAPCEMCLWQRWPHGAAAVIGAAALVTGITGALVLVLGALAALTTAGIGLYHSGVERDWWDGPASCTGGGEGLGGIEGGSLLPTAVTEVNVVMCDAFEPFFLGLTMANYNALASLGLAVIWLFGLTRPAAQG